MWLLPTAYMYAVGKVRRHGKEKYELQIIMPISEKQRLMDAVRQGKVAYVELYLPPMNLSSIIIYNKPRVVGDSVYVGLPARFNKLWYDLWQLTKNQDFTYAVRVAVVE